jgi:hypothetical protein
MGKMGLVGTPFTFAGTLGHLAQKWVVWLPYTKSKAFPYTELISIKSYDRSEYSFLYSAPLVRKEVLKIISFIHFVFT